MKAVDVYYSIEDCGDGSAYPKWFLTENDAGRDQDLMIEEGDRGWSESCTGRVETFVGSNIHKLAVINSEKLTQRIKDLK